MASEFIHIFLEEAHDILMEWEKQCLVMHKNPTAAACDALFRAAHNLKGSARSVGLDAYAHLIHAGEDLITLVRSGQRAYTDTINRVLLETQSLLMQWRDQLLLHPEFIPEAELIAAERRLRDVFAGNDAALLEPEAIYDQAPPAARVQAPKAPAPAAAPQPPASSDGNTTLRVASSKIDALMQLVGELATHQATISHFLRQGQMQDPMCRNAVQMASKITRELQMQTMGLRLVDLSPVFQRLERTARELAVAQGKKLHVELEGREVELDKAITERILDALLHMVRNSVDHGIETLELRSGKAQTATLRIRATQIPAGIAIEISDDGRGIDPERVKAKAVELGLVDASAELSKEKIYEFLFYPGFSTAREITEVSGRGVGLDVVRQTIDSLGGSLQIASELGQGTSFKITLPVNVSIVDALIILVDQEHYVVPIQEISEVIDLKAYRIESQHSDSITIELRKKPLPIKHLSSCLARMRGKARAPSTEGTVVPAMIIEVHGHRVGFQFDKVVGHLPIMIRKLSPYLADLPGFSGSTILGSGEPAVIISPKIFAERCFDLRGEASA